MQNRPDPETQNSSEAVAFQLTEKQIRENARHQFQGKSIVEIALRQAFYENWLKVRKHVSFRSRENQLATQAYCAMSIQEFEGINARQIWANWRTVPFNLNGRLPNRPLKVIDLCCGIGQSTDVLSYYLPKGSQILGLEFNPEFVKMARSKKYQDKDGKRVAATFNTQSVLETFKDPDGKPIKNQSVDLVNSCGAVGAHFNPAATEKLAEEVARILKPNGLALIDSGSEGTPTQEVIKIFKRHDFEVLNHAKSCFLDRFTQVCFRKRPSSASG